MTTPPPGTTCTGHLLVGGPTGDRVVNLGLTELTIGREPGAAGLALETTDVSRRHASLTPLRGGGHRIVDQRSTNGVFVNDVRISAVALRSFDRVRIGAHTLLYLDAGARADLIELASVTTRPRAPHALRAPAEQTDGGSPVPLAWLDCPLLAPIPLHAGVTTLGRGPGCDHVLPHASISRQHAAISVSRQGERMTFEDFSSNGSLHNGVPVTVGVRLRPGDRLVAGPFELEVRRGSGVEPVAQADPTEPPSGQTRRG